MRTIAGDERAFDFLPAGQIARIRRQAVSNEVIPWHELRGGYRSLYDPRSAVSCLVSGANWNELWDNLHHQGDVGEASYVAVPMIAELVSKGMITDWNAYALVATIERARHEAHNPPMPTWAAEGYARAWDIMFTAGLAALEQASCEALISAILAVLATYKRQPVLSRFALLSEDERRQILREAGWG